MNSEWQDFLSSTGAQIENGIMQPFNSPQQEAKTASGQTTITALSHLGLIQVGGADAASFLQNQFTNDIREVTDNSSQLSAWCSPKGRALACFRLFIMAEHYYMLLPASLVASTRERLARYILMSKVTLEESSNKLATMGVAGPEADALLNKLFTTLPARTNEVCHHGGCTLLRIPGPSPRFAIAGEPVRLIALWSTLSSDAQPVGSDCWRLLDIQAGLPSVYPETVEAFVPQMLNLQAIDGLSFSKGCYPGQEVVARMQYLGKLKRRMYRAVVDTDAAPVPGDTLRIAGGDQGTGKIVDAHPAAQGGYELLAVVEIAAVEAAEKICLEKDNEAILTFVDLPYPVAESES